LEDKLSCAGQDKIDCDDDLLEDAIEGEFFRWSGRCPFDVAELARHKGCCDVCSELFCEVRRKKGKGFEGDTLILKGFVHHVAFGFGYSFSL
jgi:hypothetical protein